MIIAADPPRCASGMALSTLYGSTHLIFTMGKFTYSGKYVKFFSFTDQEMGHRKVNLPRISQVLGGGLGFERRCLALLA